MNPIGKIIIGGMLVIASIASIVYSYLLKGGYLTLFGFSIPNLWTALLTVVAGVVPAFVCLIGIFIVWLELDELKIEKELAAEEKKMKKPRKGR